MNLDLECDQPKSGRVKPGASVPAGASVGAASIPQTTEDEVSRFYTRFYTGATSSVGLGRALLLSLASHLALWMFIVVAAWVGFLFRLWAPEPVAKAKPADIEFVLVPKSTPEEVPLDKNTRFRADHATRAKGQAKHLAQVPQSQPRKTEPQPTEALSPKHPRPEDSLLDQVIEAQGPQTQTQQNEVTPDALAQTTVQPYMDELKTRIHAAWHPPRGNDTKRVVLRFRMKHEGTLDGVWIEDSSGEAGTDDAAIRAIVETFPFKPLPDTIPEEKIDIQFTFDYKVFGDLPPSGENG